MSDTVSEREAARRAGVSPATLQRWVRAGLVPQARDGRFTTAAIAQARIVARLRRRCRNSRARVIKTIGDEVMIVGAEPAALASWAIGIVARRAAGAPVLSRIGVHAGPTLYRDGDYCGRSVNLARAWSPARPVAR